MKLLKPNLLYSHWLSYYRLGNLSKDILAGIFMGILVIPQSLGYASLAGLPPITGLYASIVPTLVYAFVGASPIQAVGPVAISAIMTSASLSNLSLNPEQYLGASLILSLMVGAILLIASVLKLGLVMQFISRGVSAGFISAGGVLIIISQLKNLFGLPIVGTDLLTIIHNLSTSSLLKHTPNAPLSFIDYPTALVGLTSLILLSINRLWADKLYCFLPSRLQNLAGRIMIVIIVLSSIYLVKYFNIPTKTLTSLPNALPYLQIPSFDLQMAIELLPSALLMAFIVFVSTGVISTHHANTHDYAYSANKELVGLGLANIASGVTGGFVVAGGLSRTSLNLSLGAKTPLAGIVCACVLLMILAWFSPVLIGLPFAVLSAVIISSVVSMIDFKTLRESKLYGQADFVSFLVAFFGVLIFGFNIGLVLALIVSFGFVIHKSNQVHIAVVGQVIGTNDHFRNIHRYKTRTFDNILLIRIDENLYFGNSERVKNALNTLIHNNHACHVVIIMTAVNHIDMTASQMLVGLNQTLHNQHKKLHFCEIKGFVMDILKDTPVIQNLSGQVFLSTLHAVQSLTKS